MNYLVKDGKTNYFAGGLLIGMYIVYHFDNSELTVDYCRGCRILSSLIRRSIIGEMASIVRD